MRSAALILFLAFSSFSFSDPKLLTCEGGVPDGGDAPFDTIWTALVDTDDFSKERHEYELTVLKMEKLEKL